MKMTKEALKQKEEQYAKAIEDIRKQRNTMICDDVQTLVSGGCPKSAAYRWVAKSWGVSASFVRLLFEIPKMI